MKKIKPFHYIPQLDCFIVNPKFQELVEKLGLSEWSPVVFLGRLFAMDNDYGEHWGDNWDEREALEQHPEFKALGLDSEQLMIVVPARFKDGRDGPCNSDEVRKLFWTDTLISLELSYDFLFAAAVENMQNGAEEVDLSPNMLKRIKSTLSQYMTPIIPE